MSYQISKKRKFVQDGVFKAELDEFLTRELAEDGYSGVEVSFRPESSLLVSEMPLFGATLSITSTRLARNFG